MLQPVALKITCPHQNQAELVCANRQCHKPGTLCFNKTCQCRKEHRKCLLSQIQEIMGSIIDSKTNISEQAINSFATIQKIIDNMIEELTAIKSDLGQSRQNFSLRKNEKKLFLQVSYKHFENVNGKLISKVLEQFQKGKKPQIPSQKQIQQNWKYTQKNFETICSQLRKYFKIKETKENCLQKVHEQKDGSEQEQKQEHALSFTQSNKENRNYLSKSKKRRLRLMGTKSKYA